MQERQVSNTNPAGLADGCWRVQLLGGLRASSGDWVLSHFPSRAVAVLLARLALHPQRSHAREELIELLWPGVAIDVGRNRLRAALSTLRRLLEPPASAAGSVIVADRQTLRTNAGAIECDAVEFERALRAGRDDAARSIYRGELLPGFYDAWVMDERARLTALHERLVEREARLAPEGRHGPASDAAAAGPQPQAAERRLPGYLSSFVGRDVETRRLVAAINAHRLVTLTGTGGCGKTRLAVEVARACGGVDATVFVALADCRDGAQLADRVRAAVRLPLAASPALEHLAAQLAETRVLLVLDNFEQLVDEGGPQALAELLEQLPLAHTLVTSRRALRLAGEHECALAPLVVPDPDDDLPAATGNPAVALFIDRARCVRGDFGLTAANRADVLRVCRALEGLPLALEIAATRIRTYSPHQMAAELSQRFALLVRAGRHAAHDPRHASLHATIAWSWRLLAPSLQGFLACLSVFRGGCSVAEVSAVTGVPDAHDRLDALVADSLLSVDTQTEAEDAAGGLRFRMLEAVREFVREHIDADAQATLRRAHRAHFLSRALELGERHQPVLEAELPNFVEAMQTALEDGEHALALALALALKLQWEWVGTPPEALTAMRRMAELVSADTPRHSSFLCMLARLLLNAGHADQASTCAARAVASAADHPALRAEALLAQARVDWVRQREGALQLAPASESLRLAVEAGAPDTQAQALILLGAITLWHFKQPGEADALYVRAANVYAALGNPRGALQTWHGRMACLQAMNQHDSAIQLALTHEPQAAALGQVEAQILFLNLLSLSYEKTRRYALALDACRREARLARRQHKVYNIAYALWNQCHYLARLRRPEAGAMLMAFSQKYWVDQFGPLLPADSRHVQKIRRLVVAQIGAARWQTLWSRGLVLSVRDGLRLGCGEAVAEVAFETT